MNDILHQIEKKQLDRKITKFHPGDLIEVKLWIIENNKKRTQIFAGIVIAIKNRGLNSSFTVRKIVNNEGIERVFQTYSPNICEIIVKRYGFVRKAKLYYIRNLTGKAARIKEKILH